MTNGEMFKTAEERKKAFENYCLSRKHGCNKCELGKFAGDMCRFAWLDLEYKEELKPCPFCGGEARIIICGCGCSNYYHVKCKSCFCASPSHPQKDNAVSVWNRREK